MKLVKCPNNHYYDGDMYTTCPVCSGNMQSANGDATIPLTQVTEAVAPTEPIDIFDRFNDENKNDQAQSLSDVIGDVTRTVNTGDETIPLSLNGMKLSSENKRGYVVGWLVCIKGENKGASYNLYTGKNFIGRNNDNDIILKDKTVSRQRHGNIVYEPKAGMFLAAPSESRELYYLNDQVVLSQMALTPYDIISLGESELLFIPLVGHEFSWDDYKDE